MLKTLKATQIPSNDKELVMELQALYVQGGKTAVEKKVREITNQLPWREEIQDKKFCYEDVSQDLLIEYCCKDTWTTARVGEEKLYIPQSASNMPSPPPSDFTRDHFKDLIWFLAHLERYGLPANKDRLLELKQNYYEKIQDECKSLLPYQFVRDAILECAYYIKAVKKRNPAERFSLDEPPEDLTQLVNTKSSDFMEGVLRRCFVCLSLGAEPTHYSISVPYYNQTFFKALVSLPRHAIQSVGKMHWDFRQDYLNYIVSIGEDIYGVDNFPHLTLTEFEGISFSKDAIMPIGKVYKSPDTRNSYINDDTEELTDNQKIWRSMFWINIWRGILSRDIGQYIDYVVNGTLRTSFRPVKAAASPMGGGADTLGGGSISRVQSTPNIQNFKTDEEFRSVFHCNVGASETEPEEWFCELDFSTVEPRTLAMVANISRWKEYFRKGLDIYRVICNEVDEVGVDITGDPEEVQAILKEKIPTLRRDLYKQQVLAVMYERGPSSFAAVVGISVEEAYAFFDRFKGAYPEIEAWKDKIRYNVQNGQPVENMFGRRVIYDYRGDESTKAGIIRSAINFGIQSSGSCDIPIWQLVRVLKHFLKTGLINYAKPRNFIHDAGWFTFQNDPKGFQAIVDAKFLMEDYKALPIDWDIPLPVGGKMGTSPGNMREDLFLEKFGKLILAREVCTKDGTAIHESVKNVGG